MKMSSISLKAVGLSMRASTPLPPSIISLQMGNVAYREFSAADDFEQRTQEETYFLQAFHKPSVASDQIKGIKQIKPKANIIRLAVVRDMLAIIERCIGEHKGININSKTQKAKHASARQSMPSNYW